MTSPVIEKLNKRDLEMCRAFRSIVNKGKFEIQGDALAQAGAFFNWFSQLEKRIEETLKPVVLDGEVKPIEEKKKK